MNTLLDTTTKHEMSFEYELDNLSMENHGCYAHELDKDTLKRLVKSWRVIHKDDRFFAEKNVFSDNVIKYASI